MDENIINSNQRSKLLSVMTEFQLQELIDELVTECDTRHTEHLFDCITEELRNDIDNLRAENSDLKIIIKKLKEALDNNF